MIGFGDEIIASGLARGAKARGKRIAFGDGKRILWTHQSHEIFRGNPNVAHPGDEGAPDLEWIKYHRGRRLYGTAIGGRWQFHDFKCPNGEIFFAPEELEYSRSIVSGREPFVLIEPKVKPMGACVGDNKQWPTDRYQAVADELMKQGVQCIQFSPVHSVTKIFQLARVPAIAAKSFRLALAVLSRAALYIGPEGGLHHGSAAVGIRAVVIWGGFNSPKSTGYPEHHNIAVGEPCGTIKACPHCRAAMASISVKQVIDAALGELAKDRQRETTA